MGGRTMVEPPVASRRFCWSAKVVFLLPLSLLVHVHHVVDELRLVLPILPRTVGEAALERARRKTPAHEARSRTPVTTRYYI